MQKKPRQAARLFVIACILAAGAVSAGRAQELSWPLSREMLSEARLSLVWQEALALGADERLEAMTVVDDRLYIRSNRNYVWSIRRQGGTMAFYRSIAPAGFPILGWVPYDDRLLSVITNQLVEFDKNTGARGRVADLELSIIAPVVRNDKFYYVSAADGRLHVFRAEDMVSLFRVAGDRDAVITSVMADNRSVVFGTDTGRVVGMATDSPQRLWQFQAGGSLAGPVVTDGRSYFFASKDTRVYRIDVTGPGRAEMTWRYQTEAILDREPRVTNSTVYQYAPGKGLVAIDKQDGKELWSLPEGIDLLAESGGRAYVTTSLKTLAIMDNVGGKQLYSVNLAAVTKFAANTVDGYIYVADERGHVACLRPTR